MVLCSAVPPARIGQRLIVFVLQTAVSDIIGQLLFALMHFILPQMIFITFEYMISLCLTSKDETVKVVQLMLLTGSLC